MQIEVLNGKDGTTVVRGIDPSKEGEEFAGTTLEAGERVAVTLPDVHEAAGVQFGEVTEIESADPETEKAAERLDEVAPPAEEEQPEQTEIPAGLGIARAVIYRSKTGAYDLPAVVTATVNTLDPRGVDLGHVPELTGPTRVHLTVFTCGKQGTSRGENEVNNEAAGGSYQEFNIPQFADAELGAEDEAVEIVAGTWRWPERV